jgi:hypothetical protein
VGSAQRSGYKKFFEGEKEDHKEQVTPIFLERKCRNCGASSSSSSSASHWVMWPVASLQL